MRQVQVLKIVVSFFAILFFISASSLLAKDLHDIPIIIDPQNSKYSLKYGLKWIKSKEFKGFNDPIIVYQLEWQNSLGTKGPFKYDKKKREFKQGRDLHNEATINVILSGLDLAIDRNNPPPLVKVPTDRTPSVRDLLFALSSDCHFSSSETDDLVSGDDIQYNIKRVRFDNPIFKKFPYIIILWQKNHDQPRGVKWNRSLKTGKLVTKQEPENLAQANKTPNNQPTASSESASSTGTEKKLIEITPTLKCKAFPAFSQTIISKTELLHHIKKIKLNDAELDLTKLTVTENLTCEINEKTYMFDRTYEDNSKEVTLKYRPIGNSNYLDITIYLKEETKNISIPYTIYSSSRKRSLPKDADERIIIALNKTLERKSSDSHKIIGQLRVDGNKLKFKVIFVENTTFDLKFKRGDLFRKGFVQITNGKSNGNFQLTLLEKNIPVNLRQRNPIFGITNQKRADPEIEVLQNIILHALRLVGKDGSDIGAFISNTLHIPIYDLLYNTPEITLDRAQQHSFFKITNTPKISYNTTNIEIPVELVRHEVQITVLDEESKDLTNDPRCVNSVILNGRILSDQNQIAHLVEHPNINYSLTTQYHFSPSPYKDVTTRIGVKEVKKRKVQVKLPLVRYKFAIQANQVAPVVTAWEKYKPKNFKVILQDGKTHLKSSQNVLYNATIKNEPYFVTLFPADSIRWELIHGKEITQSALTLPEKHILDLRRKTEEKNITFTVTGADLPVLLTIDNIPMKEKKTTETINPSIEVPFLWPASPYPNEELLHCVARKPMGYDISGSSDWKREFSSFKIDPQITTKYEINLVPLEPAHVYFIDISEDHIDRQQMFDKISQEIENKEFVFLYLSNGYTTVFGNKAKRKSILRQSLFELLPASTNFYRDVRNMFDEFKASGVYHKRRKYQTHLYVSASSVKTIDRDKRNFIPDDLEPGDIDFVVANKTSSVERLESHYKYSVRKL